jgi:hypothetical protein
MLVLPVQVGVAPFVTHIQSNGKFFVVIPYLGFNDKCGKHEGEK